MRHTIRSLALPLLASGLLWSMTAQAGQVPGAGGTATDRRWSVTLAASMERFARRLVLSQNGQGWASDDTLWEPVTLWVGARYRYSADAPPADGWRGDFAVGVAFIPFLGAFPLAVQHSTLYSYHFHGNWALNWGGRLAFIVDLPDVKVPRGELGLPIGVGWKWVEVQWIPSLVVPLRMRERSVYHGSTKEGASLRAELLHFQLSFVVW